MKNLLIDERQLEEQLREIEENGQFLAEKLLSLSREIKYILSQIKLSENATTAGKYFDLLQKTQVALAKLMYVSKIGIPDPLCWFVRDFERIDDNELRNYIFNKIKNDEYSFGKKLNG